MASRTIYVIKDLVSGLWMGPEPLARVPFDQAALFNDEETVVQAIEDLTVLWNAEYEESLNFIIRSRPQPMDLVWVGLTIEEPELAEKGNSDVAENAH